MAHSINYDTRLQSTDLNEGTLSALCRLGRSWVQEIIAFHLHLSQSDFSKMTAALDCDDVCDVLASRGERAGDPNLIAAAQRIAEAAAQEELESAGLLPRYLGRVDCDDSYDEVIAAQAYMLMQRNCTYYHA